MAFKNTIFVTDKKGLDNIISYIQDPEGKIGTEESSLPLDIKAKDNNDGSYWIKISAIGDVSLAAYDNLILQFMYNEVKLHNIKFFIPENETENIEKFIFSKNNKSKDKSRFYIQHMQRDPENKENDTYTVKISCHKNPSKQEIIKLTGFMRQYI